MNQNYWQNNEKVRITTDEITIPATNGKDYSSNSNNHVLLDIPKNIPFFIGDQSYLRFRLKLEMTAKSSETGNADTSSFVQLIPELGANAIIKNLSIRNSQGKILEQINEYNVLKLAMNQYDNSLDKENFRSITEGTVINDYRTRVNNKDQAYITTTRAGNTSTNPYFRTLSDGTTKQTDCDVCIPLSGSGILGSNKIVPNSMLGLRLEIELEEAYKVIRATRTAFFDSNYNVQLSFGRTTDAVPVIGAAGDGLAPGKTYDRIYIFDTTMDMVDIHHNPFKVGEFIGVRDDTATKVVLGQIKEIGVGFDSTGAGREYIYYDLETPIAITSYITDAPPVYSRNLDADGLQPGSLNLKYDVSNLEFVIKRCEVEAEYLNQMNKALRQNGSINYEFPSFSNYQRQVLATEINSTINLPLQNSMARSVLLIGTIRNNSAVDNLTDFLNPNKGYFNLSGQNKVNNYQFTYQNRLHPNRRVDLLKTNQRKGFNQIALHELTKALIQGNIPPNSLRDFKNNMIIGRSFSSSNGFYDTRSKDTQINIDYTDLTGLENKLFQIYCAHIRRIVINNDGINVIV